MSQEITETFFCDTNDPILANGKALLKKEDDKNWILMLNAVLFKKKMACRVSIESSLKAQDQKQY